MVDANLPMVLLDRIFFAALFADFVTLSFPAISGWAVFLLLDEQFLANQVSGNRAFLHYAQKYNPDTIVCRLSDSVFHSKIWFFLGNFRCRLFVGSDSRHND